MTQKNNFNSVQITKSQRENESTAEARIKNLLSVIDDYAIAVDYYLTALGSVENDKVVLL